MITPKFFKKIRNYFRVKSLKKRADSLEESIRLYGGYRPVSVNEADKKTLLRLREEINKLTQ